jgi:hypothetical protein
VFNELQKGKQLTLLGTSRHLKELTSDQVRLKIISQVL